MNSPLPKIIAEGRPTPVMEDLIASEVRPLPDYLASSVNDYVDGGPDIDKRRYYDPEFYRLEKQNLWSRVWQMACRTDDIPNVGDYIVYEVGEMSLIVVRIAPDKIKAFHNSCLHRGRVLCEENGNASNFRCKFHGMMWKLDGSLRYVPSRWDFSHIKDEEFSLPEAQVDVWNSLVFVNPDPKAITLKEQLSDVTEHFSNWNYEKLYTALHVGVIINCNWKIGIEAFLENMHVLATHPEILPYHGYEAAQYHARKDRPHYSRHLAPNGLASTPFQGKLTESEIIEMYQQQGSRRGPVTALPEGKTAREHIIEQKREHLSKVFQDDLSTVSAVELVDNISYCIFPNMKIWGGYTNRIDRFRPWQDSPDHCLFETMVMMPKPKDGPVPPPAKMRLMEPGKTFSDVPELGFLGPFLDQDVSNMEWVHKGLKASVKPGVTPSNYQESQIRHFNRTIDMYVSGERVI